MQERLSILAAIMLLVSISGCQGVNQAATISSTTTTAEAQVHETIQEGTSEAIRSQWTPIDRDACSQTACILQGHFLLENPIPIDFNQLPDITYLFGSTQEGVREIHHGVEFANPTGTPILAAADGRVVHAGDDALEVFGLNTNFYGNLVILQHKLPGIPQGLYTLYAHLSQVSVEQGQEVKVGQELGRVGRSGSASGSHLHFEVRWGLNQYSEAVNPELWLRPVLKGGDPDSGALSGIVLGPGGEPLRVTNIQLQYSLSEGGQVEDTLSLGTYVDQSLQMDPVFAENFTLSNLKAGWYRVTLIANGAYSSRWVQIENGKLTYLTIQL